MTVCKPGLGRAYGREISVDAAVCAHSRSVLNAAARVASSGVLSAPARAGRGAFVAASAVCRPELALPAPVLGMIGDVEA